MRNKNTVGTTGIKACGENVRPANTEAVSLKQESTWLLDKW